MTTHRRHFLHTAALSILAASLAEAREKTGRVISVNTYNFVTFAKRDGKTFDLTRDEDIAWVAQAGAGACEPGGLPPALVPLLKKHKLNLPTLYVGTKLHDKADAQANIDATLKTVELALPFGCKILVTNPAPIQWGQAIDKNEDQLKLQAEMLNLLGEKVKARGLTLAYHNHDMELRQGAREFHHMLSATDPANVSFCLDAHWVYRGCGNSQIALFDVVRLYGKRIVELHLRQSVNGTWTETFGAGDIDYPRLNQELTKLGVQPALILEQAIEAKTPNTMDAITAHKQSLANLAKIFATG